MASRLAAAVALGNLLIVAAAALEFVFRAYLPAIAVLVAGVLLFFGSVIISYAVDRPKSSSHGDS